MGTFLLLKFTLKVVIYNTGVNYCELFPCYLTHNSESNTKHHLVIRLHSKGYNNSITLPTFFVDDYTLVFIYFHGISNNNFEIVAYCDFAHFELVLLIDFHSLHHT
jgi:hypothetical protein